MPFSRQSIKRTLPLFLQSLRKNHKQAGIVTVLKRLDGKAIIQSMTPKERVNPDLIKASQRKRIAKGSGTSIQEVNQLMKQFEQTKMMMKNQNNPQMRKLFRGRMF